MAHLSRSWRPHTFDQVIGQPLVVRLLKNSLFLGRFFPVYLFAGQRGCGKTTLARIFAAAINCEQYKLFKDKPHEVQIPCASCSSCQAALKGYHPDIIEVDAASHTGVDHVRSILEASTLAPQMGIARVYIIDEAHMLSKAAFAALLKTLEEPIGTVIFLLATTDLHKIADTVRSRCLHLFIKPHTTISIAGHLQLICEREKIEYEERALHSLAATSEGSLRDAINELERVVIAYQRITMDEWENLVGMPTWIDIASLGEAIGKKDAGAALKACQRERIVQVEVGHLWRMLYELFRLIMWEQCGNRPLYHTLDKEHIERLAALYRTEDVLHALCLLSEMEPRMLKSSHPRALFEVCVRMLCAVPEEKAPLIQKLNQEAQIKKDAEGTGRRPISMRVSDHLLADTHVTEVSHADLVSQGALSPHAAWQFIIGQLEDPLQRSCAQQATLCTQRTTEEVIILIFPVTLQLFAETLTALQSLCKPLLQKYCGRPVDLEFVMDQQIQKTDGVLLTHNAPKKSITPLQQTGQRTKPIPTTMTSERTASPVRSKHNLVAQELLNDENTQKILKLFPGTVISQGEQK